MKCKRFRIEDLRNEEWFQFYTGFKALAVQFTPEALNIDELFVVFLVFYANADATLEVIRKNAITEQLADADQTRDSLFRGLAEAVQSALRHFDAEKREAARRLNIVFDQYGNVVRKSYDEETASIYNFLQEMSGEYAPDIAMLGLSDWVNQLDVNNKAFNALMETRYDKDANKTNLRLVEIRKDTDRNYRDMLDRIDASILLNGEQNYAPFVKELNVRIERYSNILAQRKGRAKEARKKKAE